MNRLYVMLLLCLISGATAFAVTAYPKPHKVVQPDGSIITVIGHGDEYFHYLTTIDSTIVEKGIDGLYHPVGHNPQKLAQQRGKQPLHPLEPTSQNWAGRPYRGLVILVNFNDRKFSRGDEEAHTFFDKLMNEENWTKDNDRYYGPQTYTGSVRDYFSDNSFGQFVPEFDVVGPIDMDFSQYYIDGVNNNFDVMEQVMRKADETVDYTQYDADGNGEIDMVYVIFAGYSSNYMDNDERLMWPHASHMKYQHEDGSVLTLDGMNAGRFACSAEIFGWHDDGDLVLDGIGTIVHEFSHVLGFQDHYDSSNGYQEHPNTWDVMAAGNYSEDFNRTPCAFNSYEKYVTGFIKPLNITEMDGEQITLQPNESSSDACILRSYQDSVFFMMENRQPIKWDKSLIGQGLLVWRVDSTNTMYWDYNAVNVTTRACFRLVRACGTQGSFFTGVVDTDYDSFPGTNQITELDNDDDRANLISYDGYPCPVVLRNIDETNGMISFDVEYDANARNEAITYQLADRFTATGERLEGDEWVPETWTVTKRQIGDLEVLCNFLPNPTNISWEERDYSEGIYVGFTCMEDSLHTMNIYAQRVAVDQEHSTWICDQTNVDQQGSGTIQLIIGRYGVPALIDPSDEIGYCLLKPSAYMVSLKGVQEKVVTYRNIVFSEIEDDPTDIEAIETHESSPTDNSTIYDLHGQPVDQLIPGHIYIINRHKVIYQ